jgi:hypothetical protein
MEHKEGQTNTATISPLCVDFSNSVQRSHESLHYFLHPEDGGNMFLRYVGTHLPDVAVSQETEPSHYAFLF